MKELDFDTEPVDSKSFKEDEDEWDAPIIRYTVLVEMIIKSTSVDDAIEDAKAIIDGGVISLIDNEDRTPLVRYDVLESDPDELD